MFSAVILADQPTWLDQALLFLKLIWPILLVCLLGCASIYLLLPRPRPFPTAAGAGLGTLTLILTGVLIARGGGVTVEAFLFYLFSAIAIATGTILVTQHNPARAALSFTLVILSTCGLFLLLAAPFLMAATIIIYAGAIVVTFLFVLMLAQQIGLSDADLRSREPLFASFAGFLLLGAMLYVLDGVFSPREYEQQAASLDQVLKKIQSAEQQSTAEEINKEIGGDLRELLSSFKIAMKGLHLKKQSDEVEDEFLSRSLPEPRPGNEGKLKELLGKLLAIGSEAQRQARLRRSQVGLPHLKQLDRPARMSSFSGPPPSTPPEEVRFDPQTGVPLVPAENAAYLGRSLFTDYLLPVELGGFLLLVAVVGAIAIAQRSSGPERVS
jgi:NADH:ubiquinone oxidoreductase subunit 6 (subunit J)